MPAPLLLIGPPGCGKTAAAFSMAKTLNLTPLYLSLADRDECEIAGGSLPDREAGCLRYLVSEAWKTATSKPTLVILDELTAASRTSRIAALRYADPSAPLHKRTRIIATANPPEYAAGAADPLSAPELGRFRIRVTGPMPAIQWLCGQHGEVGLVGRYLRANPAAAMATPEEMTRAVETQSPYASPRSWHRAAMEKDNEAFMECVGASASQTWLVWKDAQDLPEPIEILAGTCNFVPKRADLALATACAVTSLLISDRAPADSTITNALKWYASAADSGHAGICALELKRLLLNCQHAVRLQGSADLDSGILKAYTKLLI